MYQNLLISIVSGTVIAIVSSYLTSIWTMKKFYTEKWWDRKEQAYTEIINALYDMIQFYKVYKEDYGQDDFISDERATDLRQKYSDGIRKLYRATDLATLYVSEEAVNVLVKLRNREILDQRSNPLWEVYELEYKYYNQSLTQLLIIAKKDLKK
ncbi:TPA: hypothetical protein LUC54_000898 [Acinetobacter baumannii]|uniref:DUF4760 domain-containing protein n=3 Tax=Acinetobacter baumannii TaxID=470 RepID=A0ABX6CK68_ACIB2|nr:hypothetical protein [Acinetobacter baumannii]EEX03039.1 hypothetical protein HMPREF0010_02081 [Acinetobacter baumannii ATCC 19606 = CIP 70.34 = JCM 6841]EME53383.1 hypothetical protein G347_15375 [Acinetobacter baumannii MSP4-16]ARN29890.1 hypothetical protein A4U85_03965 [Acinetobacter baumannii]EKV2266261.1 hypothetical protein [Acinetobacter baumannii]EKV2802056.1 hypothetical protein [Acinetobacter baumannii]